MKNRFIISKWVQITYVNGIYKYGLILYEGQYIDQDIQEVIWYFELESSQGHSESDIDDGIDIFTIDL